MSGELGKVGKKGELYPPKSIREKIGLDPDSKVRYMISPKGDLIVKRIFSASELLNRQPLAHVTAEEIEELSETMQNKLGNEDNESIS